MTTQYIQITFALLWAMLWILDIGKIGLRKKTERELLYVIFAGALLSFGAEILIGLNTLWLMALIKALGLIVLMFCCLVWGRAHWLASPEVPSHLDWRSISKNLPVLITGAVTGTAYSILLYRFAGAPLSTMNEGVKLWQIIVLYLGSLGTVIAEEVGCRYYLQGRLTRLFANSWAGRPAACVIAAATFAIMHTDRDHQILRWIQVFPLGLFIGYLFLRGGLVLAIAGHWLTNVCIHSEMIVRGLIR